jgi:succinate-acetate transporter protein
MAEETEGTLIQVPPVADPAALGLAGFALTTFLLSAFNAGWAPDLIWVGCAFFYGGLAQFMAGMWEFRNRNTFGATAFGSYGAFWMSLAFFIVLDLVGKVPEGDVLKDLGWFLLAFAIFNTYMLIWSSRITLAVFLVFLVLEATEIILFIGFLAAATTIIKIGGIVGIIDAIIAWYTSAATVGNSMAKRIIAPVGGPLWRDNVAVRA